MKKSTKGTGRKGSSIFQNVLVGIAVMTASVASLCVVCSFISPEHHPLFGPWGLLFPFLGGAALLCYLLSLLFAPRRWWLPLLFGIPALYGASIYAPVSFSKRTPKNTLDVMTYNVMLYGFAETDSTGRSPIATYVAERRPDIFMAQEAATGEEFYEAAIYPVLKDVLPYNDKVQIKRNQLRVFSRFPILAKGQIEMPGVDNGAAWFKLLKGPRDTLLVVNCHLQFTGISVKDREAYHEMAENPELTTKMYDEGDRGELRTAYRILRNLGDASAIRSQQVNALAAFIAEHKGEKMILGGDFNDSPVSYARQRIARELTDCFVSAGNGASRSFNKYAMFVRIDHLFCSEHFKPCKAEIDNSISVSDHYPLLVSLAEEKN